MIKQNNQETKHEIIKPTLNFFFSAKDCEQNEEKRKIKQSRNQEKIFAHHIQDRGLTS